MVRYLARSDAGVETAVVGMHRRNVQVRLDVAVGGDELSDLKPLAAAQLLAVQEPRDVGSGVARCDALETERWAGTKGLLAEAVTDLGWFN